MELAGQCGGRRAIGRRASVRRLSAFATFIVLALALSFAFVATFVVPTASEGNTFKLGGGDAVAFSDFT